MIKRTKIQYFLDANEIIRFLRSKGADIPEADVHVFFDDGTSDDQAVSVFGQGDQLIRVDVYPE